MKPRANIHEFYPSIFVVRLWHESRSDWRASVHHPNTGQRWYFAKPEELANFLTNNPTKTKKVLSRSLLSSGGKI